MWRAKNQGRRKSEEEAKQLIARSTSCTGKFGSDAEAHGLIFKGKGDIKRGNFPFVIEEIYFW